MLISGDTVLLRYYSARNRIRSLLKEKPDFNTNRQKQTNIVLGHKLYNLYSDFIYCFVVGLFINYGTVYFNTNTEVI